MDVSYPTRVSYFLTYCLATLSAYLKLFRWLLYTLFTYVSIYLSTVCASVGSPRRHRCDANKISIETVKKCIPNNKQDASKL